MLFMFVFICQTVRGNSSSLLAEPNRSQFVLLPTTTISLATAFDLSDFCFGLRWCFVVATTCLVLVVNFGSADSSIDSCRVVLLLSTSKSLVVIIVKRCLFWVIFYKWEICGMIRCLMGL